MKFRFMVISRNPLSLVLLMLMLINRQSSIPVNAHIGYVNQFGSPGSGDGQFNSPTGTAINDNHIFIADSRNNRVQIFDLAGNFQSKFGSLGPEGGQFGSDTRTGPDSIALNDTHIFVTDWGNFRIQIFDLAGNFQAEFGSEGNGDGQFRFPAGIAVNSANIFIATKSKRRNQEIIISISIKIT